MKSKTMNTKTAQMSATAGAVALLAAAVFAQTPQAEASSAQEGEPLRSVSTEVVIETPETDIAETESQGAPLRPLALPSDDTATEDDVREIELDLRTRLAARDLDARMRAFDDAVEQASASTAAREALEEIASDTLETELAFTARLALREVDSLGQRSSLQRPTAPGGSQLRSGQRPLDPFEAMRQEIERAFGGDPFGADFFAGDPFMGRSRFGVSPFGRPSVGVDPFERIQEEVKRIEAQLDALRSGAGHGRGLRPVDPGPAAPGVQTFTRGSSMSVSMTPEGIRVEITEDDGSGPETKTYEAPNKEALLEAHPELKDRLR